MNGTERTDDTDRDLSYRDGARDTSGFRDKPEYSHQKNNNYANHFGLHPTFSWPRHSPSKLGSALSMIGQLVGDF